MNDDFLAAGILWKINRVFLDANKFVTVERDISEMALKNIPIFVVSNCCSRERSKIYLYQKKKKGLKFIMDLLLLTFGPLFTCGFSVGRFIFDSLILIQHNFVQII